MEALKKDKKYKLEDAKIGGESIKCLKDYRNFPELLAIYNNNLRVRMDLVADIVTSVPVSENTRWLFKDVLKKFTDNRILADTISGSDNFTYEFQCDYKKDNDIKVSIPNDVLGMDAFSVILENIIRNCAKHGSTNNVKLMFHIEDGFDIGLPEYHKVTIHKNCGQNKDCKFLNHDCPIIRERRIDINMPILSEKNQDLRPKAWGILEMKIAAAYLRKIPPKILTTMNTVLKYFKIMKIMKILVAGLMGLEIPLAIIRRFHIS